MQKMTKTGVLFIFILLSGLTQAQDEFVTSDLLEAREFGAEAYQFLLEAEPLLDSCEVEGSGDAEVKCLYHAEGVLNQALEAIDNSYYDIDQAIQFATQKDCKTWTNDLTLIREYLGETESSLSIALDKIRSAENDLVQSNMDLIVRDIKVELMEASDEIQRAGEAWRDFMIKESPCK
jgi:hypothetical protein